jgi:hypothetical protein
MTPTHSTAGGRTADKIDGLRPYTHHHSSDPDFCGSTMPMRAFSLIASEVTCPRCRPQAASEARCDVPELVGAALAKTGGAV